MAWFINCAFCSKKIYILMWNGVTYFIGVYITKNNGTLHVHLEIQKFEILVWKNISLICFSTFQVRFRISKRPCIVRFYMYINRASDISQKKKQNFAGFSGTNSQKNRPISQGKSQNSRKNLPISRDFHGRKVKIHWKIVQFRGILSEKKSNFEGFRVKFLEKSADFTGNFGRKLR